MRYLLAVSVLVVCSITIAEEPIDVWPGLAPGETTAGTGVVLPPRPGEVPPVTRVENITRPTMTVHVPARPTGAAVIILPGGGFSKVVPDKEGTEAADWLTQQGLTCFVLSYRTTAGGAQPGWVKPLQDAQRAMKLVRSEAGKRGLKPNQIGLVGFSAGGQVGARLLCDRGLTTYDRMDVVDDVSHRPDFAILIYPWNLYDATADALVDQLEVPESCPPVFLVHTHDDNSSALGAVLLYQGLKKHGIASELHVYGNGGHGYGLRPVPGSQISTWPDHAAHWLHRVVATDRSSSAK